jgi:hypothetical protein
MARYRAPAAWLASDVHAVVRADLAPSPARWVADPALLLSVTAVRAGVYHEVFLVPDLEGIRRIHGAGTAG